MTKNSNPTVTASDIGQAARCPHALYLSKRGCRPNQTALKALSRGTKEHAHWTRSQEPGRSISWPKVIICLIAIVGALTLSFISSGS